MQTFLSEPTFERSARALDNKRLTQQLTEGRQILSVLTGETTSWAKHPATLMWAGAEEYLFDYLFEIRQEMHRRGIKYDTVWKGIQLLKLMHNLGVDKPLWTPYTERVVITHRANLYFKDPDWYYDYSRESKIYRRYVCCDRCKYFWVTHL
jgi:hypothetical protein